MNAFCLFGKKVKLHLLVSPYRWVLSVALAWDHSLQACTEGGRHPGGGCLRVAVKVGVWWGMEGILFSFIIMSIL